MGKAEVFHKGIEAFNRRDVEAFLEVCHPDCEWQPFLRARDDDAPYRTTDGIRQWFDATDAAFEGVRKEAIELREANGTLLALGRLRYRGRVSGVEVTSPVGWVLEFRDGKIARTRTYLDLDQAVESAALDRHAAALAA
ncbi:MAG TPA: nuclear transport factor 2 family protein [Solirubrobacterales bacterium]|nr:nuclear transport factor 2 family protein [Solirubrobacterales bacterium]